MKNSKCVYFVILNFNAYEDTGYCIESIINSGYDKEKIIIVDNASSDGSYDALSKKYTYCNIIKNEINSGYACGNNLGIKYALNMGADYICIINNDVEVEQRFLEPLLNAFAENKDLGIVGPCICDFKNRDLIQSMGANIDLYRGLAQAKCKGKLYKEHRNKNTYVDYLGGACFLAKSEIFKDITFIPENYFLFFEETEFCLKVKKNKYKLMCIGESRVFHKGSSTISKYNGLSYFFLNRNRVVFIRRNANNFQKTVFSLYIFIEVIGRMIIRREPSQLFKNIVNGFKANKEKVEIEDINRFLNKGI